MKERSPSFCSVSLRLDFGVGVLGPGMPRAQAGKQEYALLDHHNQVTPRAIRIEQIRQAANRYRDELWTDHKETGVGVLYDWHNEAVWAAMNESSHEEFKNLSMHIIGRSPTPTCHLST
ncbi:hypothetical protein [Spirosoma endbachense]|uniref:Uncharacterized protein n=1 Tax=Spirosoma endbachense TaxID=2666025 RepID=A0A6P1W8F8_9BACT|nr:hypothetical protein [Spirosoma endbachense]QHW00328.1 hypothetical protein GJR95_37240 [Spirosoma endbachense]